jgi:hypothetical protein
MTFLSQFRLENYDEKKILIQIVCHFSICMCLPQIVSPIHFCKRSHCIYKILLNKLFAFIVLYKRKQESQKTIIATKPYPQVNFLWKETCFLRLESNAVLQTKRSHVPPSYLKIGNALVWPTHKISQFSFLRHERKFIYPTHSFIQQLFWVPTRSRQYSRN